jgi:hypothetical protein
LFVDKILMELLVKAKNKTWYKVYYKNTTSPPHTMIAHTQLPTSNFKGGGHLYGRMQQPIQLQQMGSRGELES